MGSQHSKPGVRLAIALLALCVLAVIAKVLTGQLIPTEPREALLFQSSLLLVVLGSSVIEQHFTKPAEALVNALTAFITLVAIFPIAPKSAWWTISAFLGALFVVALVCIGLQNSGGKRTASRTQRVTYLISSRLGQARIVFSVVFIGAIAFFYEDQTTVSLTLLVFWGIFMSIWPLGLPEFLSGGRAATQAFELIGTVDRVDSPRLVRVSLATDAKWAWESTPPVLVHSQGSEVLWAVPLASEDRADGRWGTALLGGVAPVPWRTAGAVERPGRNAQPIPTSKKVLGDLTGLKDPKLVGFVIEGSTIETVRIETLAEVAVAVGDVVGVYTSGQQVLYQIVEAQTREEPFGGLHFGSVVATAQQIGIPDVNRGMLLHTWVPSMNEPVFVADADSPQPAQDENVFVLGSIPGTSLDLHGDFLAKLQTHTALLGVTGSGKTEFAFDLVRHALTDDVKVIAIDLTAQYHQRLEDLSPVELSISDALATELGDKLFAVETGTFGAPGEKAALGEFAAQVRDDVNASLKSFLDLHGPRLGLIELREISNTKATLWITEMFLSTLLKLARQGALGGGKVLVVVEEAHTVMPEASFIGLGDFDSKGTVAKIVQIALQGRKYGVGLLVLAQRTATVSKSVLTQCNTVISFSCIDDTSIGFLSNMYGRRVAESMPNLPRLRAVAHGEWIRSERPVAFDVKYDAAKAEKTTWTPPPIPPSTPSATPPPATASDGPDEPPF